MKLEIVKFGHPVLRAKGRRVGQVDDAIRTLAADMLETMHAANGVGLAAQQIGHALQLTVVDVSGVEDRPSGLTIGGVEIEPASAMPMVLLNPELQLRGETVEGTEGCLSFPEINAEIERAFAVVVKAETLEGQPIEMEVSGLLARALQHEVDHLHGILFIDRMSSATKASLASRLKKMQKETKREMMKSGARNPKE